MNRFDARRVLLALVCLLPLVMFLYLGSGPNWISPGYLVDFFFCSECQDAQGRILGLIRLPRVIMAALLGACLASSGMVMQGLFRNPLADPSLIGVSAGASTGASFMIVFGVSLGGVNQIAGLSLVSLGAVAGAVIAVLLVYRLATNRNGTSVVTMLLSGVAITAGASALNSLFTYFADSTMLRRISVWEMGSLEGASWQRVVVMGLVSLVLLVRLPGYRQALNAFLLGESEARHLGVPVERAKKELIILTAIAVGVGVVVAGNIAFVGLIVPHILRSMIGPDHRALLPACALAGALLLVLADLLARLLIAPAELPAGILTSLLGAPVFFYLLARGTRMSNPERL